MRKSVFRAAAATAALVVASGCASSTIIKTQPPGAKVYLNGEPAGKTPYEMSDTKIVGSSTYVKLVMDGYEQHDALIQRNEEFAAGPCIGGVLVLFPFLWIMGYKPEHNYELTPVRVSSAPPPAAAAQPAPPPAAAR